MKQIKTIVNRLDNHEDFDEEVNRALSDGWSLIERRVIVPKAQATNYYTYHMLYAELEKGDDETEFLDLFGLIDAMKRFINAEAEQVEAKNKGPKS